VGRLVIRGGAVVDGTGAPPRPAEVLVVDGRIADVDATVDGSGAREIDASGAVVTPGFIDNHTHLDPSLFWDRDADPLPQHGVTSVLIGNCSLGLAPVRADQIDEISKMFCYIEDIPRVSFDTGIPWSWESYEEYVATLSEGGLGINVAPMLGHSVLRMYVMGNDAWEREATDTELERLTGLLADAMDHGAFGLSTSFFDTDAGGRLVPSRIAARDEHAALIDVLARTGRGLLQIVTIPGTPDGDENMRALIELCGTQVTSTTNVLAYVDAHPAGSQILMDLTRDFHSRGMPFWPQMSPRTIDFRINWESSMVFMMIEPWHGIPNAADDAERRRLLEDPEWRARAREAWANPHNVMFPTAFLDRVRLVEVTRPELEPWVGRTLEDLVAERGGHPSDVLADWVLENELRPGVVVVGVANSNVDEVGKLLADPDNIVGSSDAGAHFQMLCAAGDTTLLLTRHVRDRGDLTLEAAVRELTGKQSDLFGFRDRGYLRPGLAADLTVFALDELHWDDDVFVTDQPGGARRLRRPEGGYRYTIANGEVTQEGGALTGARAARVLHSAIG